MGPSSPEGSTVGPRVLSCNLALIYHIFFLTLHQPSSSTYNPTLTLFQLEPYLQPDVLPNWS